MEMLIMGPGNSTCNTTAESMSTQQRLSKRHRPATYTDRMSMGSCHRRGQSQGRRRWNEHAGTRISCRYHRSACRGVATPIASAVPIALVATAAHAEGPWMSLLSVDSATTMNLIASADQTADALIATATTPSEKLNDPHMS